MSEQSINESVYIERVSTIEDVGAKMTEVSAKLAEDGCLVASASLTIDDKDPVGRYILLVVGRSIGA